VFVFPNFPKDLTIIIIVLRGGEAFLHIPDNDLSNYHKTHHLFFSKKYLIFLSKGYIYICQRLRPMTITN